MRFFKVSIISMLLATPAIVFADLVPVSNSKEKCGYADESGKEIIPCKYDEVQNFDDGLYKVTANHKVGLFNESGQEILPVKYDIIEKQSPTLYLIGAGGKFKDGVILEEKYGFANPQGQILLKPEYEEISQFQDGLAYVLKDNKYGYINEKIEFVVPCKYAAVGMPNQAGYIWVNEGGKFAKDAPSKIAGGKFGIYHKSGKEIVPVKYKKAGWFEAGTITPKKEQLDKMDWALRNTTTQSGSNFFPGFFGLDQTKFSKIPENIMGFWMSTTGTTQKNGLVDLNGNMLVQPGKYYHIWYPTDGMAMVQFKEGFCQINFLDVSTGNMLLDENAHNAWGFQDGYAIVIRPDTPIKKGAKAVNKYEQTLINTQGKTVSNPYVRIFAKVDGGHIVLGDNGYGYIASNGTEVIPTTNSALFPASEGLMLKRETNDSKIGFVDKYGSWVINPIYTAANSFMHGWAAVKGSSGWGYINPQGEEVVPCQFHDTKVLNKPNPEVVFVYTDDSGMAHPYHVGNKTLLGDKKYGFVRTFDMDFDGVALVGTDGQHIGVIDLAGLEIIPFEFDLETAKGAYLLYQSRENKVWSPTDTYRVKLNNNDDRNKGRLEEKLKQEMWDY